QRRATRPRPKSPAGACVVAALAGLFLSFAIAIALIGSVHRLEAILVDVISHERLIWLYSTGLFVGYIQSDPAGNPSSSIPIIFSPELPMPLPSLYTRRSGCTASSGWVG